MAPSTACSGRRRSVGRIAINIAGIRSIAGYAKSNFPAVEGVAVRDATV
ncbi:hypothetical protein [Dietzia cinnamea]|nr:hypothetical protein [Dietzia cinnamea]MCT2057834.1 hypothetical protein [Dietzia cinnamea]MCT2120930.1 hypothetical protein [Dietzia cinnamea]MCT2139517.1 hypothetical protein [Dietzia cinnamea]MCT2144560.1 hypothetical protein [Dietzia cinnamea]MCT2304565.1 hypothetical protein [Dietzia cinnamea]